MSTRLCASIAVAALAGCGTVAMETPKGGEVAGTVVATNVALCESPAHDAFARTICICEDFDMVGGIEVRGSATGDRPSVGVNGYTSVVASARLGADFIPYGGLQSTSTFSVGGAMSSAASILFVGDLSVDGDLMGGGDLTGVGALSVGGTLGVQGETSVVGTRDVGATGSYAAPSGPPCGCGDESVVDVAAEVARAKEHNDNAASGLPTNVELVGDGEVRLSTGIYYFDGVANVGALRFTIAGNVALNVDGSLDNVGSQSFSLEPGATLDLFVSGAVRTVGDLELGGDDPSAFRLYVGGESPVILAVGDQTFRGSIYAPRAAIDIVGNTLVEGSLFARSLTYVGELALVYARPPSAPQECPPADDGGSADDDTGAEPDDDDPSASDDDVVEPPM